MKSHMRSLTRHRVAFAQTGNGPGFDIDLLVFLNFLVAILTAVDNLITRKADASS